VRSAKNRQRKPVAAVGTSGLFLAVGGKRKAGRSVKQDTTKLSKQARAVIQIAGAIMLVFGVEAVSNGAQFSAWMLLPTAGWLFGRSLSA
jgi:hypothetical protein